MEILVCIKQVPDDSVEMEVDEATGKPLLDKVTPVVNAFDTYALEMAVRLKEENKGTITVLTVAAENVEASLRSCLSVGADKAYIVKENAFQQSDSNGISLILSKTIEKIEEKSGSKFDIIFCGLESTDCKAGQVGLRLGEYLEYSIVSSVIGVESNEDGFLMKQETEEGFRMIAADKPCVVTVTKPEYDPRYPTMKSKLAARKVVIDVLGAADLDNLDTEKTGLKGSYVKVVKIMKPQKKKAGVKIQEETDKDSTLKAISMMVEAKLL